MIRKFEFNSSLLKNIPQYKNYDLYNTTIYSVSSINNPKDNTLIFVNKLNEEHQKKLSKVKNCIILLNKFDLSFKLDHNCLLYVDRPRKEYAKILDFIIKGQSNKIQRYTYMDGYCIGEDVIIGENTIIEPYSFIDHGVTIGSNCIIKSGARIRQNVSIGNNCIIKENSVIGTDGFGVERDEDGTTYKIPHLGGVNIGNNVEVGALTCICQGTVEPTIIKDYVKIDDNVFIAHNCNIEKGTYIIANSEVSGSVSIGKNCWISPNSCIRDGLIIGDNSLIGIGAVVVKDIESNSVVAGNPAIKLK
ncbi:UDP-3-O-(3-hydroxymyristoyl)glucosamine N-acyltransferase [Clostridium thermopalmarium]|uniref:UDP-3-O-(3-hydroxymyristoyl)glucosamine N-acyltransferase n=1 Tax=Clostridium thermopalmarium DSM 5974 TaxID=1121340 RepID=A0A2T0AWK4_9CLOT|nr:UDP-3-O-(3-hydroxymyristoyl)glucosamine N-acyltransferase [Clostridium thermopalmarium]PRR75110.1 UDP-3-O-(3-hydroxymyristoyl)glucosamine N-acyltransferase [Clostridium thermopalmarium DSM 5974]PVZ27866.1 UDP-3-O-[3-hydroxymyristoyl] glucosamine N-acyltransferase [Clostridium thermopalmarium DSM 5974]